MIFEYAIGPERSLIWVSRFFPVVILSFVGGFVGTWLFKRIALKFNIVDRPDATGKTHTHDIAYLGGLGILAGVIAGVLYGVYLVVDYDGPTRAIGWLLAILAGGAIACFIGLLDDVFDIKPTHKIAGQLAAACVLLVTGILPNLDFLSVNFSIPVTGTLQTVLEAGIVVFFVLGATNSLNLLDGLDGLCAGVTAIITVAMLVLSVHLATWGFSDVGDPVRIIICLALVGAVCGFLPFNRHPARIFMGDAGSMLLGFVIASLMMLFAERTPRWWLASVVVFGLPILDTAVAFIRRIANKRPVFVSDRGHIYDQMIDRGIPLKKTVMISYLLAGLYAAIGLFMSQIRTRYAGVLAIVVGIISLLLVWKKGYFRMHGLRGAVRKNQKQTCQTTEK